MPSLAQDILLDKFKRYCEIQKELYPEKYTEDSEKFIQKISIGICSGLTSIWFLFIHLDREDEFYKLIEKISSWGGSPESLTEDLETDINYFFSIANFLQHGIDTGPIFLSHKKDILQNLSIISTHQLEKNIFTAFNSNKEQLKTFISSLLRDGTLTHISGTNHVIGLYKKGDVYFLYDPNNPEGVVSGNLDELSDRIFNSIAAPAGYNDSDIMTINLTTYENSDILDTRKMDLEELSVLHEAAGHYLDDNKYSSKYKASPFYIFAIDGNIDAIKELLSKAPINLFQNFRLRNASQDIILSTHAQYLLSNSVVIDNFADIIAMSTSPTENEKVIFLKSSLPLLVNLTDKQISTIISSLNLSRNSSLILFGHILRQIEDYLPLLKYFPITQEEVHSLTINSLRSHGNYYIKLIQSGLIDPNCIIEGSPILHQSKLCSDAYLELVKLGANQFQRNKDGKLAIDYFIDGILPPDDENKLTTIISLVMDLSEQEDKNLIKDLLTVIFMSKNFQDNDILRDKMISDFKAVPYGLKASVLSRLLSREDIEADTVNVLISSCKDDNSIVSIITEILEQKKEIKDTLSPESIMTLEHCQKPQRTLLYRNIRAEENMPPKSASAPASRKKHADSEPSTSPSKRVKPPLHRKDK